ncbi:hypothetical protein RR42_m3045 [Cupriavidus basilensis]|uniref:Uncharacterized protein n=1 Tax=Cupriavidus basilensis TaxID=68895 RepID=A0A0C4YC17_9BURK|nr:hypothetical protein RR42_m3045 [Cupriavidus basilensis]
MAELPVEPGSGDIWFMKCVTGTALSCLLTLHCSADATDCSQRRRGVPGKKCL